MGLNFSFLDKPVTDKESFDDSNEKLACGASSMQGWRQTQEDAHNCIAEFDTNTSFFAVYDGHGGREVSTYCSKYLPDFIKNTPEYQENKIEEALTEGFLRFDAKLKTPEVMEELQEIMKAARKEERRRNRRRYYRSDDSDDEEEEEEEENVDNLYEEATMPLEQVIKKYASKLKNLAKEERDTKDSDATVDTSASCSSSSGSSSMVPDKCSDGVSSSGEAGSSNSSSSSSNSAKPTKEAEANKPESASEDKPIVTNSLDAKNEVESTSNEQKPNDAPIQNNEVSTPDSEAQPANDVTSTSLPVENGTPSKKTKGKAIVKPDSAKTPTKTRPKRNAQKLYEEWLNHDDEEDSEESDEDQTFEGPNEESSDDEAEGVNVAIDTSEEESSEEEGGEGEEDNKDEDENEDDDDDDDDDDDEEKEDEDDEDDVLVNIKEVPGSDSGCTAVAALLKGNELYVANVGDSRCILCRDGKAVEMSYDHKPKNKEEYKRIVKAGGRVCFEGRVNGGLNLSRALGDHAYKQNSELSDREQMITALPDIKKITINPNEDEFMVLACDGIWDSLSNQEVIEFVRPRILEGREKLSTICEEMFDDCLSKATTFDGKGCDNMTAIIVKFKSTSNKRSVSPTSSEESKTKRIKADENESKIDTPV